VRLAPIVVVIVVYVLMTNVFGVSAAITTPVLAVLCVACLVYFGGRLYRPFYVDKKTTRCVAKGGGERTGCRHYIPGAKMGGGCGRLQENGRCRYIAK
jgi:hypothetical protein